MYGQTCGQACRKAHRIVKKRHGAVEKLRLDVNRDGGHGVQGHREKRVKEVWKCHWQPPCYAGCAVSPSLRRCGSTNKQSEHAENTIHNVSLKPTNPRESALKRLNKKDREGHVVERWFNSLSHHKFVQKPTPILQAMRIPGVKAAVDKEWEKLEKLPAWHVMKVKSNNEVVEEAHKREALFTLLH